MICDKNETRKKGKRIVISYGIRKPTLSVPETKSRLLLDRGRKTGKEKQKRGQEKQSRGKEKQPLSLFFPCLKKKVDGIAKLKAGQGRMTKILVNFLWNHGQ